MHRSLIVWIMLMALGCSVGYADSLPVAPAQVSVPVMDRSAAALQQGVQAAFAQAMLQISGDAMIMSSPAMQDTSKNAMRWVQRYEYVEQPAATPQALPSLRLQVIFDQHALASLVQTNKINTANKTEPVNKTSAEVQLIVTNIDSMSDYVLATKALRDRHDVKNVAINTVGNNQVNYEINIDTSVDQFKQDLLSDNRFRTTDSDELRLAWAGQTPS